MHINMKYYVVTIGAIFISLGVGMLVGFNLNYDQELSKQQAQIIDDLDVKFEKLKNTNNDLKAKLKSLNLNYDKTINFINANVDKIILEELTDKNVGIISINKNEDINHAEDTILKANGNLLFNINFTDKFIDEVLLTELSKQVEIDIKNSEQLVSYVLDVLKNEGAREKLQPLQDLGLIKIKSLEPEYMNTASVVLDGDGYVEKVEDLSKALIEKLKQEKHVVGIETTETESSLIGLYSENKIATINNIDEGSGQLALVLALKDGNLIGNFGIGDNVESLIPYK